VSSDAPVFVPNWGRQFSPQKSFEAADKTARRIVILAKTSFNPVS